MKVAISEPRARSQSSSRAQSLTTNRRLLHLITSQNPSLLVDPLPKVSQDQSSWTVKDEERTEVGLQLTELRKKHDLSRSKLEEKDTSLYTLRSELVHLSAIEENTQISAATVQNRIKLLEAEIEKTRSMRDHVKDEKYTYEHVLNRMKRTRINLELQAQHYTQALKTKQLVVAEQLRRMRSSQANSAIAKQAVDVARSLLTREEQQQESQALILEKNARLRQEIASKRDKRQTRQAEIAEFAANMQEDGEETRLRQGYLLHRFWWNALQRKLEKDKAQSVEIEEAFQRIKIATGLGDVHDMVERFLTKEQTYERLMHAVTEAEQRVERLKRDIEEEQSSIKTFLVSEQRGNAEIDATGLGLAIEKELKEVQTAQNHLEKHEIAYDHIAEWLRRIYSQFHRIVQSDEPNITPNPGENYLLTLFNRLTALVQDLLQPLHTQRDSVIQTVDSQNSKKAQELLTESPETLRKAVRVRVTLTEEGETMVEGEGKEERERELEDWLEQRRRQRRAVLDRVESARRKKAKEKKQETKK